MNRWREDPRLKGRFPAGHPDDLQVIVHDGGPRITQVRPELVWVTISDQQGDHFSGRLLNQPHQLKSVSLGDIITFVVAQGAPHPVMVTPKYLSERRGWKLTPCDKCGFSELFDAPSDLIRRIFPDVPGDAAMEGFTTFCPLCAGIQVLEAQQVAAPVKKKAWWKPW